MATNSSEIIPGESDVMERPELFYTLLIMLIPSILCSVALLTRFLLNRRRLQKIRNHVVISLLSFNLLQALTDVPLMLRLLQAGKVISSDALCQFWIFMDYVLNVVILMLVCYGSIQRYLLVFHRHFINAHVILLHYIPLGFCIVYPTLFYVVVIFFYPCTTVFLYDMYSCGGPCYLFDARVSAFDQLAHIFSPVVVIIASSIFLLIRVVRQMQRMKRQNVWTKNRRLIVQILTICCLHAAAWAPIVTIMLIVLFSPVPQPVLVNILINWVPFSYFLVVLLHPIIVIVGYVDDWMEIFRSLKVHFGRTTNSVYPIHNQR